MTELIIFSAVVAAILTFIINIKRRIVIMPVFEEEYTGQKYRYTIRKDEKCFVGYSNRKYSLRDVGVFAKFCLNIDGDVFIEIAKSKPKK